MRPRKAPATKTKATLKPQGATEKSGNRRLSNAERSAYFARREAAKVLRTVLQGDARRLAVGSIKSLVYSPSVRNKKATYALVCQTLKHLGLIKDVLESATVLNSKWKRQEELMYIIAYDILFGQDTSLVSGDAEKFLMRRKDALQSAMAKVLVRKKAKSVEDLIALYQPPDISKPCYVRINTLKLDVDSALRELGKQFKVQKVDIVPDLLMLPPHTDLHNHPLVLNGSVFVQGKASSMVAAVLDPKPGWKVLDACSAPGNKTVHLAALMRGKGKIIACELNKDRIKRLEETIQLSGAPNIEVLHGDFLNIDPNTTPFSKVSAILLDPSCSGSGTSAQRLDHLLPSHTAEVGETERLNKLAAFQKKALSHALSFPAVKRVVYSTCSIHQTENEDVIASVLPFAASNGFQLPTPFPQWHRRGLPVFEGSQCLLRTDPVEDKEGFFIALFVRKGTVTTTDSESSEGAIIPRGLRDETDRFELKRGHPARRKRFLLPVQFGRISKVLFLRKLLLQKKNRYLLCVGVLWQSKFLQILTKPSRHAYIPHPMVPLPLPPPLSTHNQRLPVLNLHFYLVFLEPRHVHHKDVRIRQLFHVCRGCSHGSCFSQEGSRWGVLLRRLVGLFRAL